MFILLRRKHKLTLSRAHYTAIIIFAIYIVGVLHFTGSGTLYNLLTYKLDMRLNRINLIPFSTPTFMVERVLNIFLFVPFGFLVPHIWKKLNNPILLAISGLAFSLLIELSQLLNIRSTDVDDLILNTLGTVTGFIIYKLFTILRKPKSTQNAVPAAELPIYILAIFIGRFFLFNELGIAGLLYGF